MNRLKRFLALAMMAVLLFAASPVVSATQTEQNGAVFTEVEETVYATTAVNVRTGPATSYTRISTLRTGEAVERIGVGSNGWSKVIYNGREAYIYSIYLSTTRPIITEPVVDYNELTRQIAIANGLKAADYTRESWEVLSAALDQANDALSSKSQETVDEKEQALAQAITGLVQMNYAALEQSLADFRGFVGESEQYGLWEALLEAVRDGEALLTSGDQAAVDAAAARIAQVLAEVRASEESRNTPSIVVQEVPVEVPPTDDYCNIPSHRVWPVLFFVSLVLNLVMGAVIVAYVSRKKKKQKDDIPLVDYDIDDDM